MTEATTKKEVATKKYILLQDEDARKMTERPIDHLGKKLYRIKALREVGEVQPGELGGYVEGYDNLSQDGNCWISRNSKVHSGAKVEKDAILDGTVELYDGTIATDGAFIGGYICADHCKFLYHSRVQGKMMLRECVVTGSALVTGDGCTEHMRAEGSDMATVFGFSHNISH